MWSELGETKNNFSPEVCINHLGACRVGNSRVRGRRQVITMLSLISKKTGERMPTPLLLHIPLGSAYLCQDCNSIGNCARQCPACASEVLMSLAGVLDREVEPVVQSAYAFGPALVA